MKTVELNLTKHSEAMVVLIQFPYDTQLISSIKQIPEARWSNHLKSWYVPYSIEMLHQIKELLEPIALINAEPLKHRLREEKKKFLENTYLNTIQPKIELYKQWMQSKRYSVNTIGVYTEALIAFLKFHQKPFESITNQDIIHFNNEFILKNKLSSSYQNQVVNAIILFFSQIENKVMDIELIHRPKRGKSCYQMY